MSGNDSSGAAASSSNSTDLKPRRTSRSIKRKKFDDEVVESSLPTKLIPVERTRRVKRAPNPKQVTLPHTKWGPKDDLKLILAVQQCSDLALVHKCVKFSQKLTYQEIEERWYQLLYIPEVSGPATAAIATLTQEEKTAIERKTLWSSKEEAILQQVEASSQPKLEFFVSLLHQHPLVFHPARTPRDLMIQWERLRQYSLLADQTVQPLNLGDSVLNFSDVEEQLTDEELLSEQPDPVLQNELRKIDRRHKIEIRKLEDEIRQWHTMVGGPDNGPFSFDLDNETYAALRGRLVRYLMRSKEITLGRTTPTHQVDVDFSLEGPAWKISLKQGIIKYHGGEFFLWNFGKRPIYIDGHPVIQGCHSKLHHHCVMEICSLKFIFIINKTLTEGKNNDKV
ncbi:microspherule protein 1-like isoform X3 [Bolinopsis microptera]|uniref:microspherule protein 1-like isoform X3 n=1 Tax=Bolinopsis microptera TaxID=2820187 RepID=UPI00307AF39A